MKLFHAAVPFVSQYDFEISLEKQKLIAEMDSMQDPILRQQLQFGLVHRGEISHCCVQEVAH